MQHLDQDWVVLEIHLGMADLLVQLTTYKVSNSNKLLIDVIQVTFSHYFVFSPLNKHTLSSTKKNNV